MPDQVTEILLAGGMDNSTETTLSQKPINMTNCWYNKVNGVQKRYGITKLTTGTNWAGGSVYASGSLNAYTTKPLASHYGGLSVSGEQFWSVGSPLAIVPNKDGLVCFTSSLIRQFSPARDSWANQSTYVPVSSTAENGTEGVFGTVAVANERIAHAFSQISVNTSGQTVVKLYGRVLDANTKEPIVDKTLLFSVDNPSIIPMIRVIRLGSNFVFIYTNDTGAILRRTYTTSTDTFSVTTTYATFSGAYTFEVDSDRFDYTQYAIVAQDGVSGTILIVYSATHVASATLVLNALSFLGLSLHFYDSAMWVMAIEATFTVTHIWRVSDTPAVLATTTRSVTTGKTTACMSHVLSGATYALILIDDNGDLEWEWVLYSAGAISTDSGIRTQYGTRLRSYPINRQIDGSGTVNYYTFVAVDDNGGHLCWFYDTEIPSGTTILPQGAMVNSYAPGEIYAGPQQGLLTSFVSPSRLEVVDTKNFILSSESVSSEVTQWQDPATTADVTSTIRVVNFKIDNVIGPQICVSDVGVCTPLGAVRLFDGANAVDFNHYTAPSISVTATAGGSMTVGSYSVAAVYRHQTDARVRLSIPSVDTVESTVGNNTLSVVVGNAMLTDSDFDSNPIIIEIYMTEANSDIYYFAGSVLNNRYAATSTIAFSTNPSTTARQLYTTGNVLDNSAPPGGTCAAWHQNRLFVGGTPDDSIRYTKEYVSGEVPGFNEGLLFQAFEGGPVVAMESLDAALAIFKEAGIYVLPGNGPDDAGNGATFGLPQKIQSDTGLVDRKSLVSTPMGIYFRGRRGIYMLSRDFTVQYVGRAVEDVLTSNVSVTDAFLVERDNQVRFLCDSGVVLVYDYLNGAWSKFTYKDGSGVALTMKVGCVLDGVAYMVDTTSLNLWKEDTTTNIDGGATFVPMTYRTQYMHGPASQGWGRVRKITLRGRYQTGCLATIKLYANDDDTITETRTYPYDTTSWTATANQPRIMQVHPARQKVISLSIEYADTLGAATLGLGTGTILQGLSVTYDNKPGQSRINPVWQK